MIRLTTLKSIFGLAIVLGFTTACGRAPIQDNTPGTSNWRIAASEAADNVKMYEGNRGVIGTQYSCSEKVSSTEQLEGNQCTKDNRMRELLHEAGEKIKSGVYSGNNVFAIGIAFKDSNGNECAHVQIQQKMKGKLLVKETMSLDGQGSLCKPRPGQWPFLITGAFFGKAYGNNYIGGVGGGVGWFSGSSIRGCIGGVAGVASQTFNFAVGYVAGTCGQILF